MPYFSQDFLDFFKELAANNHKDWFDENRKRYHKSVKTPFYKILEDAIAEIQKVDPTIQIEPKHAAFRINRDIRFAKDKTPYKTNVSGIISPDGKKDKTTPGIYMELSPEHFRIYGGVYMLDKDQLYDLRDAISDNLEEFSRIISNKKFLKTYTEIRGEKNKRIDKEFREAAEIQPLIFNKNMYFFNSMAPETVLKENLMEIVMEHYHLGLPFSQFVRKHVK